MCSITMIDRSKFDDINSLIEILELTILAYHFIVDTKKNQQNLRLKEIDEFETNNIQSCVI